MRREAKKEEDKMGFIGKLLGKKTVPHKPLAHNEVPANRELAGLLRELQCISRTRFAEVRLPKESVIERISEIADSSAVPALEKALADMRKYKHVLETLHSDPHFDASAPGSASVVIMIKLADQLIEKTKCAITSCRN